jgi:hypothetical protein
MPRFIPIQLFQGLYQSFSDLLTEDGIDAFIKKLNTEVAREILKKEQISVAEFAQFVSSVRDPMNVVFFGWVAQNTELSKFLCDGPVSFFEDDQQHLIHQYADRYKGFLTPYLTEKLLKYSGEQSAAILFQAFSFVKLLDNENRATVESQLFEGIQETLEKIKKEVKNIEKEQDLIDLIKPVCSNEYMGCVNGLSRESYYLKLAYVDGILGVIRSGGCTSRFANWILKRMELVLLNNEHKYRITDLRQELREGKLVVKNQGSGKTPFRWNNLLLGIFTVVVLGGVFYVIYYKPFSEVENTEFVPNASFKKFTIEERRKIDSLIQIMNTNRTFEDQFVDQGLPIFGGTSSLTIRKEFKNETMERVYHDLILDAEIQERGIKDSCLSEIKYKRLPGIEDLTVKKGGIEVMIKNESEYDVVLFVSENKTGGDIHSMLIKMGQTKTFQIDKYNTIMAIAGSIYQNYTLPKNVNAIDRPSDEYKHHFCETDYSYKESINTVYRVINGSNGKIKLMLSGNKGGYFNLIDINGVLEAY